MAESLAEPLLPPEADGEDVEAPVPAQPACEPAPDARQDSAGEEEAELLGAAERSASRSSPLRLRLRRLLLSEEDELAQYARLAVFHACLLLGYGVVRVAVAWHWPDDAKSVDDGAAVAGDLAALAQLGLGVAYLNGVHTAARFAWLAGRPQYLLLYLAVLCCFGGFNQIPGLQVSLADVGEWGATAWVVMPAALLLCGAIIVWHLVAVRRLPLRPRLSYIASRLAVYSLFALRYLIERTKSPGRHGWTHLHLHHYYLGFLLAVWGRFDHPLSAGLLAVGCGLMVQGIGAYHAAPLFSLTVEGSVAQAEAAGCVFLTLDANSSGLECLWAAPAGNSTWGVQTCPYFLDRGASLAPPNCSAL